MYQDATVEGGRSDFDDKNVHKESIMAGNSSSAEPTTAGQSAAGLVKTGKLGKLMYYVYIVRSFMYSQIFMSSQLHTFNINRSCLWEPKVKTASNTSTVVGSSCCSV